MIGCKLNMRLAALRMVPREAMSTKARLQNRLVRVRDEALEEFENVSMTARRSGPPYFGLPIVKGRF
ncbi:hypothetical protein [Rhizobium leguminosarum]|uniref:hypothetical protein n=1 Tax=Rhizobium leguminosarum TaxID=384 RepID=UPI003D032B23